MYCIVLYCIYVCTNIDNDEGGEGYLQPLSQTEK
jgi:hypothetical protein